MACVTETFICRASIGPEPGMTYSGAERVRAGIAEMRAIDEGRISEVTDQNIHGNRGYYRWIYRWPSTAMVADEVGCDWIQFRDGLLDSKDAYRKVRQHPTVPVLRHLTAPASAHSPGASVTVRLANAGDAEALLQSMEQLAESPRVRRVHRPPRRLVPVRRVDRVMAPYLEAALAITSHRYCPTQKRANAQHPALAASHRRPLDDTVRITAAR